MYSYGHIDRLTIFSAQTQNYSLRHLSSQADHNHIK